MNIKKVISMAAAASLGLTMLASCGGKDDSSATESKKEVVNNNEEYTKVDGKGATLTVYTNRTDRCSKADGGDGYFEEAVKKFEEENNCKVKFVGLTDYSGDIKKKMTTNDYGDVLCVPSDIKTEELATYFEPLGKYDELKDTYRWADQKMTSDKTVYGLANAGSTVGILYNKKIWEDAGVKDLPKTPEEFIDGLKKIKEKNGNNVVPYYTEFKDGWCTNQWANLVLSAAGDPAYKQKLISTDAKLFDENGGYYKVYKMLVDLYSNTDLLEEDHANTDWEGSKVLLPSGKISAICLGNWAVAQFKEKGGANKDDVAYMPVPITADDGKQYAQTSPDYFMGVSNKSENKDLAKSFVEWFIKNSGYSEHEDMISGVVGKPLPAAIADWEGKVEFFDEAATPEEYVGVFDEIDDKSTLRSFGDSNDNFKIQLAQAALDGKGEAEFKAITEDLNKKWDEARTAVLKEKGLNK